MAIIKSARTFVGAGKFEVVVNHHDAEHGGEPSITMATFSAPYALSITQHMTLVEAAALADALLRALGEK